METQVHSAPTRGDKCPSTELGRAAQRGELSRRTRAEHDDLIAAIHMLEAALGSPAPQREEAWTNRVARDLRLVCDHLRAHIESAESSEGLCGELSMARPELAYRIEQLRMEHARLLETAVALAQSLHTVELVAEFAAVRQRAAELLASVRGHHAREADLIYECFCTDIGVGD